MSTLSEEHKLFSTCLEPDKKQMMLKALDTHIDTLVKFQCSEKESQRYKWLREEIDKTNICTD